MIQSCTPPVFYDEFRTISGETWDMQNILQFPVKFTDNNSDYRLILQLRNTTDYPYNNAFFFFTTIHADSTIQRDTIECLLADRYGKWLGKGVGRIKENSFLIRPLFSVPDTGTWYFYIEQALRDERLDGIADVGIRIEKIKSAL